MSSYAICSRKEINLNMTLWTHTYHKVTCQASLCQWEIVAILLLISLIHTEALFSGQIDLKIQILQILAFAFEY